MKDFYKVADKASIKDCKFAVFSYNCIYFYFFLEYESMKIMGFVVCNVIMFGPVIWSANKSIAIAVACSCLVSCSVNMDMVCLHLPFAIMCL